MAGIGFELRRLFKNKGFLSKINGYFISTIVVAGPALLCISMVISLHSLLRYFGESYSNIDTFIAVIVYAFAFSLIITGGFTFFASRYVSDCIHEKKLSRIIPSLLGFIAAILVVIFICGNLFFLKSKLSVPIKITSYIMFVELSVIWIEMAYVSVLKDYIVTVTMFFVGVITIFAAMFCFTKLFFVSPTMAVLYSMDIGFALIMVLFLIKLFSTFQVESLSVSECFRFLKSMDLHPELVLLGLFYFIGMYSHNFIFWISGQGTVVGETFYIAPFYDVPVFYALLTIIPVTVLFTVKAETSFYEGYRRYYDIAQGKGSFKDIREAKEKMISILFTELKYLVQIQLFITCVAIVIGKTLLFKSGFSILSRDIFSKVALGSFGYIIMYVLVVFLLYFDDRISAMMVSITFLILNVIFTKASLVLGEAFYGYGFFFSTLIAMTLAFLRLAKFLQNIEYKTFAAQPVFKNTKVGPFTKIYSLIMRIGENKLD